MNDMLNSDASWIWTGKDEDGVNQYVEFRREFIADEVPDNSISLYISVDTDYAVWLNGVFIGCGQYADHAWDRAYDTFEVSNLIKPGKNVLCVIVYYQGESSSKYLKGEPGLWYVLDAIRFKVTSGSETHCRKSHSYTNGSVPKITIQLSYTFEYNAVNEDNWFLPEYKEGNDWAPACTRQRHLRDFHIRPIKKLDIKERVNSRIISQGIFMREPDEKKTIAQMVQTDFISPRLASEMFCGEFTGSLPSEDGVRILPSDFQHNKGVYLLIDLGREEAGILDMDLDIGLGTVIDIAYGEHLDDLRVRAHVGGRNFADRYICKEGRQNFVHYFTRLAGRYIQLHISNIKEYFSLYYAGLKPTDYPLEVKGGFRCPDSLWNRIYEVSIRTLHLCMHEHYEDCPWREQSLYGMDSRNQALCGYYCFGEYDFPEASFALLGDSLKDDGYLEICAPAASPITIPSFSMAWIMELADHLLFSGRIEPVKAQMPKVRKMIDIYRNSLQDNLLVLPKGRRYWHFYEWADGLDGADIFRISDHQNEGRLDAPLNLFFCLALDAAARLAAACGDLDEACDYTKCLERVKKAFHETFWDEEKQLYKTYSGEGAYTHYAELTQALAICAKACPENIAGVLRKKLSSVNNDMIETTISYSLYKFQALMEEPEKYADMVFEMIQKDWGYMLYKGATSFWETIKGADDFDKAGSLCHGWSAIPIYFYQAYLLGVKPLEPGFKTFIVDPVCSVLDRASGTVPTPYGDITVKWQKENDKIDCHVTYPEGTICIRK